MNKNSELVSTPVQVQTYLDLKPVSGETLRRYFPTTLETFPLEE